MLPLHHHVQLPLQLGQAPIGLLYRVHIEPLWAEDDRDHELKLSIYIKLKEIKVYIKENKKYSSLPQLPACPAWVVYRIMVVVEFPHVY